MTDKAINCNHAARTKSGIKAARENGATWGQYGSELAKANKVSADAHALTLRPILLDIYLAGHRSQTAMAVELNKRGVKTFRDKKWHRTTVSRLLARLGSDFRDECRAAGKQLASVKMAKIKEMKL